MIVLMLLIFAWSAFGFATFMYVVDSVHKRDFLTWKRLFLLILGCGPVVWLMALIACPALIGSYIAAKITGVEPDNDGGR